MLPFLHIGIAFVVFSIIFFLSRRPFKLSYKTASVFLLFLGIPLIMKLMIVKAVDFTLPCNILSIKSYLFTYGPFLYLYTLFEISEKPIFKKIYLLHFIPFILFTVWQYNFPAPEPLPSLYTIERSSFTGRPIENTIAQQSYQQDQITITDAAASSEPPPDFPFKKRDWKIIMFAHITNLLAVFSFIIYTIITLTLLRKHKKNIPEYFSFDSSRNNLKWLRWLIISFVILYSFVFLTAQIIPQMYTHPLLDSRITPDIAVTFYIIIFSFFAIKQPVIFELIDKKKKYIYPIEKKDKKYEKSGLKETEAENYLNLLEEFMKKEKPYLDSDLTIADLSEMLNISRHYLTQVINEKLNKNFFMYVNEYRVKEAKEMIIDQRYADYTVLRIAYESGFNSKSGFNTTFKKLTGYTPTEYKKNIFSEIQIPH